MNRTTALILVGVLLLVVSAAGPVLGLALVQWDTDYVYAVETDDPYCPDVDHESSEVHGTTGYRFDYENLSETGRRHFERALANGRYVVDEKADTAFDFQFADDHFARGKGCYAVNYEGETHSLRTRRVSQRVGLGSGRGPFLIGGLLLVLGAGSLITGVGLTLKRWLE